MHLYFRLQINFCAIAFCIWNLAIKLGHRGKIKDVILFLFLSQISINI